MTSKAKLKPGLSAGDTARLKDVLVKTSGVKSKMPAPEPDPSQPIGRGRKGKKSMAIYMTPLAKEVLDRIARRQKKSVQDMGIEALNLLFVEYGEKPVA